MQPTGKRCRQCQCLGAGNNDSDKSGLPSHKAKATPTHHPALQELRLRHLHNRMVWKRVAQAAGTLALVAWLSACSAVGALNALTPQRSQAVQKDVAYGPLPRQQLDIYRPKVSAPAAGWPVGVALALSARSAAPTNWPTS